MGCSGSAVATGVAVRLHATAPTPPSSPPPEHNRRWEIAVCDIYAEMLREVRTHAPALELPTDLAILCADYVRDASSACRFDHVGAGDNGASTASASDPTRSPSMACVCGTARCRECTLWLACPDPPEVATARHQRASVGWGRLDDDWYCAVCYAQRVCGKARDEADRNEWQRVRDEREAERRHIDRARWEQWQARRAADDEREAKKVADRANAERCHPMHHHHRPTHRHHYRHNSDAETSDGTLDALPMAVFGAVASVLAHGNHVGDRHQRF